MRSCGRPLSAHVPPCRPSRRRSLHRTEGGLSAMAAGTGLHAPKRSTIRRGFVAVQRERITLYSDKGSTTSASMRNFPETFSDILTMEHRWPQKGDRLLKHGTDWDTSAGFASHQLARDAYIWDGYLTAGAALIEETERRP